jgi:GDP-L-fucose synthase
VIPDLIRKMLEGRDEVVLWGDGSPTREFLYVEDCAEGILRAAALYDDPDPVNIGNGREVFINELVTTIARMTGFEGEIRWQPARPNGQPKRQLDTTRAYERFGFRARTSLEDGLRKTIDWFEKNYPA